MSALYRQICNQILQQIASGERKVGDRLAPESEFANELGVSRSTIRMAFNELESIGVLRRRKRAGTEIIANKPQPKFIMSTSSINELLSIGHDTEFHLESITTVQSSDVSCLQDHHNEADFWLEVSGARTMKNESIPFGINQVYIPARFAGIEPLLKSTDFSVFQAIEQAFNVSVCRVIQTTSAVQCSEKDARTMGLKVGAPALQIDATLYVQEDIVMELSVARFDPSRFTLYTDVAIK